MKCLKIHQLNIIRIIKKDYKKKAYERYQSLSREEKERKDYNMAVNDTRQKCTRR